jgi:hypothetical protein
MGKNQGIIRYTQGYKRKLTKSEILRGYLFISNDKTIKKMVGLTIHLNNKKFDGKNIDGSGRIIAGKELLNKLKDKDLFFKLENKNLYITF